jgi:hypothetical protein
MSYKFKPIGEVSTGQLVFEAYEDGIAVAIIAIFDFDGDFENAKEEVTQNWRCDGFGEYNLPKCVVAGIKDGKYPMVTLTADAKVLAFIVAFDQLPDVKKLIKEMQ